MKWSIHQLNKLRHKGLTLDEMVDVSELKEIEKDIRSIDPVHVTGRVDFGSNKFTFHLHITGSMILPCSRSLVDVTLPFDVKTTEVFQTSKEEYETEAEIHYLEGEVLDLLPIIKENILWKSQCKFSVMMFLEGTPMQGQDWQVISEESKEKVC
ncbi:YceD family protein [Bacillus cytotoxicus]